MIPHFWLQKNPTVTCTHCALHTIFSSIRFGTLSRQKEKEERERGKRKRKEKEERERGKRKRKRKMIIPSAF